MHKNERPPYLLNLNDITTALIRCIIQFFPLSRIPLSVLILFLLSFSLSLCTSVSQRPHRTFCNSLFSNFLSRNTLLNFYCPAILIAASLSFIFIKGFLLVRFRFLLLPRDSSPFLSIPFILIGYRLPNLHLLSDGTVSNALQKLFCTLIP